VELVSWPILRTGTIGPTMGQVVREYGILLTPGGAGRFPAVIAIPDATHSAADITGLTTRLPRESQYARRLALSGYVVFAPFFTQRRTFSQPWINDRSWLNRLAYQTAHHLIGSEVEQVISAVDLLSSLPAVDSSRIGVAGYDQGGLTAMYAGALDDRLKAVLVSGYFDQRERAFEEPEDRMLWGHLVRFGDAEIGRLIAPRHLIVDAGAGGARIESERVSRAKRESERVAAYYSSLNQSPSFDFVPDPFTGPGFSARAIARLAATLQPSPVREPAAHQVAIDPERLAELANAQFSQWQARLRNLALESYSTRELSWKADTSSLDAYQRWVRPKVEAFHDSIGRYPEPVGPFDAQSVPLYDEPGFTGYRLSVRLYEGVHAYGILLVPKSIRSGERRPVVFTQHGYGNRPEDALGVKTSKASEEMYNRFGKKLAEKGYVVFAPMISVQQSEERTRLVRRSHLLAKLPIGLEVRKAGRMIDFLSTLPFVDKDRFAFWGLSYGGYTSLRVGPAEPRFKVVICTANYNDDTLKTTDLTQSTSYLFYPYTDPFNFGVLNQFTHSEMAFMVAPRAFMAEVGDLDGVVMTPKRFPEIEMHRVEDLYRRLGIPEKGRMSRHGGGHIVYAVDAFPFLDRHLNFKPQGK
ncbi:MAG: dienelactone hydrolase family protein, partial [Bryobacteraceae bacterium]